MTPGTPHQAEVSARAVRQALALAIYAAQRAGWADVIDALGPLLRTADERLRATEREAWVSALEREGPHQPPEVQ